MEEIEIPISKIKIPEKHKRLAVNNAELKRSIIAEGIKIPIVVVSDLKDGYILADGYQRLLVLMELKREGILKSDTLLVQVHTPQGDPEKYAGCLRIIINHHRQDFFPSQRAHYLKILSNKFNLSIAEIATSCGISRQTLENWLSVSDCIQEIRMLIDAGKFPLNAVKLITTLKREGQVFILDKFRAYKKVTGSELRSAIEAIHHYHLEYVAHSLKIPVMRGPSTEHRSGVFGSNLSIVDLEKRISDREKEIEFMRREILRSKILIQSILTDAKLRAILPGDTLKKFDTFSKEA